MRVIIHNIKRAGKRAYIYKLTSKGLIPTYISSTGLKQYDTNDLKEYKEKRKLGRPIKILKEEETKENE
jgi:hypothetical protein